MLSAMWSASAPTVLVCYCIVEKNEKANGALTTNHLNEPSCFLQPCIVHATHALRSYHTKAPKKNQKIKDNFNNTSKRNITSLSILCHYRNEIVCKFWHRYSSDLGKWWPSAQTSSLIKYIKLVFSFKSYVILTVRVVQLHIVPNPISGLVLYPVGWLAKFYDLMMPPHICTFPFLFIISKNLEK